ncbi:hypothetical protein LguiB_007854 [Lonicera macranthoides]
MDNTIKFLTCPSVARICVKMDLLCKFLSRIWIGIGSSGFWQLVEYEHIPNYCITCFKQGHDKEMCKFGDRNNINEGMTEIGLVKPSTQVYWAVDTLVTSNSLSNANKWVVIKKGKQKVEEFVKGVIHNVDHNITSFSNVCLPILPRGQSCSAHVQITNQTQPIIQGNAGVLVYKYGADSSNSKK